MLCQLLQHRPFPKLDVIRFKFLQLHLSILNSKGLNLRHDSLSFSYCSLHIDECTSYLYVCICFVSSKRAVSQFEHEFEIIHCSGKHPLYCKRSHSPFTLSNMDYAPVRTVSQNILLPSSWCLAVL